MAYPDYLDHPLFPVNAPKGQAHTLKPGLRFDDEEDQSSESTSRKYQLCDFVRTLLYKLKQYLQALEDFFHPSIYECQFVRQYAGRFKGILRSAVIYRKGLDVMVSLRNQSPGLGEFNGTTKFHGIIRWRQDCNLDLEERWRGTEQVLEARKRRAAGKLQYLARYKFRC
jgi:hypothetical protein